MALSYSGWHKPEDGMEAPFGGLLSGPFTCEMLKL